MERLAPIALFAYARPDHTRRTIEALLENPLASRSDLVVFSDGARGPEKRADVDAVRRYLATVKGFGSVTVHHRRENLGLSRSIIGGVTSVLDRSDSVIVLEDDLVTSPHFLSYMNEGLHRFALDERVVSIHGYVYPVPRALPEAFFLVGADCWGWATWRRGWSIFNPDGAALLEELRRRDATSAFDFDGTFPFTEMLEGQIAGRNDSWAVRWNASAFLAGRLTLYPGRSLVRNIGLDGSGVHCGRTPLLDSSLSETPIDLSQVPVEPSVAAREAFREHFRETRSGTMRSRLRDLLRRFR